MNELCVVFCEIFLLRLWLARTSTIFCFPYIFSLRYAIARGAGNKRAYAPLFYSLFLHEFCPTLVPFVLVNDLNRRASCKAINSVNNSSIII